MDGLWLEHHQDFFQGKLAVVCCVLLILGLSSVKMESFFLRDTIARNLVFEIAWLHFNFLSQIVSNYDVRMPLSKLVSPAQYLDLEVRFNLWLFKRKELEK